jgi:hypothetical protein
MGVLAGFGDPCVKLIREGGLYDHTPEAVDAVHFKFDIEDPAYDEGWADELEVYHNPNALVPLNPGLFPTLTHFYLKDGYLVWHGPEKRTSFQSPKLSNSDRVELGQHASKPHAGRDDIMIVRRLPAKSPARDVR